MRVATDTNVLVYAEGLGDKPRRRKAAALIAAMNARDSVLSWSDTFDVADSTRDAVTAACDLVATYQLQLWDALIVSVAAHQKCRVLLSEDLSHGFTWQGLTVVNPFLTVRHPLLIQLLPR
jgi:predicted nucleic acid-binding protein